MSVQMEAQNPAVEILRRVRWLDAEIDGKLEQIERWRALAERSTTSYASSSGSVSPASDSRMNIADKIVDAEQEINIEIDQLVELKNKARAIIAGVPDARMRLILEMRYVNGARWGEIADASHYTERNVYRLHKAALKVVSECHPEM